MKTLNFKNPRNLFALLLAGLLMVTFSACDRNDVEMAKKAVKLKATDAPIDNAEVEAVFVTVSEIYIDGKSMEGFQKTTLELSALTEGKTDLLGEFETDAQSVNRIELILDYDRDSAGNFPGSYVVLEGGVKDRIASDDNSILITGNQQLNARGETEIVLDFDLRKLVQENSGDYELVTSTEMSAFIRDVNAEASSNLSGTIQTMNSGKAKTVVYLYEKGDFDLNTETNGQGQSRVLFAKATNSAEVDANGEFVLSFVEEGMYEIHVIEYADQDGDGRFEVEAHAKLQSLNGVKLSDLKLDAQTDLEVNLLITAWSGI